MAILEVDLKNEDGPRNLDGLKRKDYPKIGNDPFEEDNPKIKTIPKIKMPQKSEDAPKNFGFTFLLCGWLSFPLINTISKKIVIDNVSM